MFICGKCYISTKFCISLYDGLKDREELKDRSVRITFGSFYMMEKKKLKV